MKYEVSKKILHNGRIYVSGEQIELGESDEKIVASLLKSKRIKKIGSKKKKTAVKPESESMVIKVNEEEKF